jgi:hypothetical protein
MRLFVINVLQEGFDKRVILVVFNAGAPIYRGDKAEDGQSASWRMQSLLQIIWGDAMPNTCSDNTITKS